MKQEIGEKERRFAELVVGGMPAVDAYVEVFPGVVRRRLAIVNGYKLMRPAVREHMGALRAERWRSVKAELVATRQEVLEFCTAVIRTPAGMAGAFSELCVRFREAVGFKAVRMPDKIRAAERLCRMMGWEPEKVPQSDPLLDLLVRIRNDGVIPAVRHGRKRLTDRQRWFAQLVVGGETLTDAYVTAFPPCKRRILAGNSGYRLARKPQVAEYIAELRAEVWRETGMESVATRGEVLRFLTAVIQTPVGMVDEFSALCVAFKRSATGLEIWMPDKIRAADRLARMQGWYLPEKEETDGMAELMEIVRTRDAGE